MFELRFTIENRQRIASLGPDAGYLCGLDLSPWQSQWKVADHEFRLEFAEQDSPKFYQQVLAANDLPVTLATASLKPRPEPYLLWLELARGTVDRIRNRVSAWQVVGFEPSRRLYEQVRSCSLKFCDAIVSRTDVTACEVRSMEAIDLCLETMTTAVNEYLQWLRSQSGEAFNAPKTLRGTWLCDQLRQESVWDSLHDLVNTVAVDVNWKELEPRPGDWNWTSLDEQLEMANQRQWNVVLGPLLKFDRRFLPDWVMEFETDFTEVRRAVQSFVNQIMQRCASRVDLCLLASAANLPGDTHWEGAARLQLVIDGATSLRHAVDNLPFVVGIAQPFSESQPRGGDYPALHLADAMLRANIEICGFALEVDFGNKFGETWPRDLCQLLDRLAQWSMFGLPLVVCTSQDHGALPSGSFNGPFEAGQMPQNDFILWLQLIDASPLVHAVFWSAPVNSQFSNRGLFSNEGGMTLAADWFRDGFGLNSLHDTHPD